MRKIAILGGGGHCKVVIDLINCLNQFEIVGIFDDNKLGFISGYPILGKLNEVSNYEIDFFVCGIGDQYIRKKIYFENKNLNWITLIHPTAIISKTAFIDQGTVICAGAIIQTEVNIGKQCIINTNCNVDHETIIGDFTNICPSVTICGQVKIGENCFIGANATIIQNKIIGNDCIVGAGSVVIRNIDNGLKVVGNPSKQI